MTFWNEAYKKNFFPMMAKRDDLGNYQDVASPAYNRITNDDSLAVQKAKQAAQNQTYQNQGMMSPANWQEFATVQPGRAAAQASGEQYNFGNAIADMLGAYWANKGGTDAGGNASGENAGVNSDYVAQALAAAAPMAAPSGSGDVPIILQNLGKFF